MWHWLTLLIQRSVILPVRMAESVRDLASVHVTQDGVAVSASKVCVIYPSHFNYENHIPTDSGTNNDECGSSLKSCIRN